MKKIFLTLTLASLLLSGFAQDSLRTKPRNNEFGIDATGFIKQFISLSISEYPQYYSPTYYLTYRRHFKPGNIRFAIGGNYSSRDLSPAFAGDTNKYRAKSSGLDTRVGWEFYNNLGKRWQVYYGIDFTVSYSYSKNDAPYWNGGYANGSESRIQTYGLSPLLGFKFKILKRLSISTEASFIIYMQQTENRRYYIPVASGYPPIPDQVSPLTKNLSTSFTQPVSVFIAFDF